MLAATSPTPEVRIGELVLAPRHGRTRLVRGNVAPPLMIQRCLYLDQGMPDMAFVFLANPTAGVLSGDRLRVSVRAQSGARAHLTTPSASKILTMPSRSACQQTDLVVEDGAVLEYMPDPVIPFQGSRFIQDTRIVVHRRSTLIYSDILTPGRTAHDESLAFCSYRHRLSIKEPCGRPVYHEAYEINPTEGHLQMLGILGRGEARVLGTFIVVTDADLSGVLDRVAGCSSLSCGRGIVLKALAATAGEAQAIIRAAWDEVRWVLFGAPAPGLRKY